MILYFACRESKAILSTGLKYAEGNKLEVL